VDSGLDFQRLLGSVAHRLFGITLKMSGTFLNVSLKKVKHMDALYKQRSERLDCWVFAQQPSQI